MNIFRDIFLLLVSAILCHGGQVAVTMKSGERLIGEIAPQSNETTLVLNSPLLGDLSLPRAEILQQQDLVDESAPVTRAAEAAADPAEVKPRKLPLSDAEVALSREDSLIDKLADLQAPDNWSGNLRFGLDLNSGDSQWQQLYAKGNLVIDPEQSPHYYRYTGSYTYRTTERNGQDVKSTDRYDANFTYRRDAAGPFFLQNSIAGRVDEVKGINHEIQELVGVGFRLRPYENVELTIGGGGGVEDYDPEFDDTRSGINPVTNVFQEFTWRPFERATFAQEFNYFVNPDQAEQYNYVLSASFRYRLTDLLGFEISFDQNFDNDVGNGNVRDDSRWRNAIIVYF